MDFDIYVTNALTGNEEMLPSNCVIINADKIEKLLKIKQVNNLNKLGGQAYGNQNIKCIDRKTGDYCLKRGEKILIEGCEKIIPIAKYYNYTGIIFCETIDGEKFFFSYKIDPKDINAIENIYTVKTKHCILNKETHKITPITNIRIQEKPNAITTLDKIEKITNYIKNYQTTFTTNQIKNKLIDEKIIDKTEITILLKTINKLLENGTLEYFAGENKEIYYQVVRKKQKILSL